MKRFSTFYSSILLYTASGGVSGILFSYNGGHIDSKS